MKKMRIGLLIIGILIILFSLIMITIGSFSVRDIIQYTETVDETFIEVIKSETKQTDSMIAFGLLGAGIITFFLGVGTCKLSSRKFSDDDEDDIDENEEQEGANSEETGITIKL